MLAVDEAERSRRQRLVWAWLVVASIAGLIAVAGYPIVALVSVPLCLAFAHMADRGWARERDAAIADLRARAPKMSIEQREQAFRELLTEYRGEYSSRMRTLAKDLGINFKPQSFAAIVWRDFNQPMRTRRR